MPFRRIRHPLHLHLNSRSAAREQPYGAAQEEVISPEAALGARREIASWPDYRPTPLRNLAGLAAEAGIASLCYKDEAERFGLGSFKALGGAYAVLRLLQDLASRRGIAASRQVGNSIPSAADLIGGSLRAYMEGITVTCATDGNHGRSVAWGAQRFGCRCMIYIHEHVSPGREAAIAAYGAEVVRVPGTYDDAVRAAARDAEAHGRHVISDTSYPGYGEVPKQIMEGYTIMVAEALEAMPPDRRPTHAFIQGGVGGLAAAVCAHLWQTLGAERPRFVVVEPHQADCLYRSAVAGRPMAVEGKLDTLMAGLAAGEVSLVAWDLLQAGADAFLTIPDDAAVDTMRLLADGSGDDSPVVGGEAGVAGLAGLLCVLNDDEAREKLALGPESRVLTIGSEGATDPELYAELVGRSPDEVAERAATT